MQTSDAQLKFSAFVEAVQAALNHLYDPTYLPPASLVEILGGEQTAQPSSWQRLLAAAIRSMAAGMEGAQPLPAGSRAQRLQQLLVYRYLQQMTQDECALRLQITPRHVRREQNDAVRALALRLWLADPDRPPPLTQAEQPVDQQPSDWSVQLRQELSALQRRQPGGSADVGQVLQGVVELLAPVLKQGGIALHADHLPDDQFAAVDPVGLRQLLVRCLSEWSRHLTRGRIDGQVTGEGRHVVVELVGTPVPLAHLGADPLVQELLTEYGGDFSLQAAADVLRLSLQLPRTTAIQLLVVDDNEDLLHFYRRFLQGTPYQVTALTDGSQLMETLAALRPDAIILDVMLPGLDGWNLLMQLRQHPLSRTMPIIVCSVIQEETLARALGATDYLAKPVRRGALMRALNGLFRPQQ